MALAVLPDAILNKLNLLGLEILTKFKFAVEIDGDFWGTKFVLGFQRVSGIGDSVEIREIREGGYPTIHRFPRRSYSNAITLERGLTFNRGLWRWFEQVRGWTKGKPDYRRTLSVYMLDHVTAAFGKEVIPFDVWRFDIYDAWPSEWKGPELVATDESLAFEMVTIQHGGLSEAKSMIGDEASEVLSLLQY